MSGRIDVDELRVGMFIHLDLGWMQHPFPVGSFRITHAAQIEKIRGLGLKQLRWSPEKSDAVPPQASDLAPVGAPVVAPVMAPEPAATGSAEEPAQRERRAQLAAQRASAELCQRQFDEANQAWRAAQVEAARALVYQTAWRDARGQQVVKEVSMIKALCGTLVNEVMYDCLQFHGGMGFIRETAIERMARDARVQAIGGGATEVMLEEVAKRMV